MRQAIKTFDIREGSTASMGYILEVYFHGVMIESFSRPTMSAAIQAFETAGYQRVSYDPRQQS